MSTLTARFVPVGATRHTTARPRTTTVSAARPPRTFLTLRPSTNAPAPQFSRHGSKLIVKASSGSEEPQTDGDEKQVDISQFFGSYFFLAVFLGTMGLAAYASYKTALVDPSQVGILAGPPSAFAAVAVAFFSVKIVQNKQKQAKREASKEKDQ